jgi:hypothetical protein
MEPSGMADSPLLPEFGSRFPDITGGIIEMLQGLADLVIIINIGFSPFESFTGVLDGIRGKLKR